MVNMMHPGHLREGHTNPILGGRPCGRWRIITASMQCEDESFGESRSDLSERPSRIVGSAYVCTLTSIVVTGSTAAAVVPEKHGSGISAEKIQMACKHTRR